MTPHSERRKRKKQPQRGRRAGVRVAFVVAAGVLAGAAGWATWLGVREPASGSASIATAGTTVANAGTTAANVPSLPDALSDALSSEDPITAVHALSVVRDMALGLDRPELLASVNAAGSPAEAADTALGQQLRADGIRFAGLTTSLVGVAVTGTLEAGQAVVALTATTSGYEERDADDHVVKSQAAGKPQELRLVLVRSAGQWKISEILGPG